MIGEVLFDASAIAARVSELGTQISRDYEGRVPVLIGVLNAAATFLADLTRAVDDPLRVRRDRRDQVQQRRGHPVPEGHLSLH